MQVCLGKLRVLCMEELGGEHPTWSYWILLGADCSTEVCVAGMWEYILGT